MPQCRSCGSPPGTTLSATTTHAPSTQPPETAPDTSPLELIAIFAPRGRGAERFTPTTIAIATLSPRAVQASTSLSTSLIRVLLPTSPQARPATAASCRPGNDQYAATRPPSRGQAARSPAPPSAD